MERLKIACVLRVLVRSQHEKNLIIPQKTARTFCKTMQTAYVEYKDLKDLRFQFSVLFGSQNVLVYVWKSVRGLKRNTNFKGDYVGAYVANPSRRSRSGVFGEIHLVAHKIGAGYVAHEIQHFLYDWLIEQNQNERTNENLALLAGNFTRSFWIEYYKRNKQN